MSNEKTPEQQNPLRVIVLYSAGHPGSAMILNCLLDMLTSTTRCRGKQNLITISGKGGFSAFETSLPRCCGSGIKSKKGLVKMRTMLIVSVLFLTGCVGIPDGVKPVENFRLENYLGQWYEIARLDHWFERDLSRVTAGYSLREDGGVRVVNRGFDEKENAWKEAEGKAFFVKGPDTGFLKVSFFGPFYGAYVIMDLDHEHYQYALVCGPDRSYLWLLARTPEISPDLRDRLVAKAASLGFETRNLIFVDH